MCTVDKLLIKGIRSFSPDNQNVIEFQRPLTLIVGSNGAGKTTIIECLKQACTGELPPNVRNGQGFVHDPKVAGETEVKAQIKLRFLTSTGQPVVVMRSFQLLQKKAGLQFKSLDSVLQTLNKDTGEKQALTYKCADIDRIIPSLMGVSKAVLENVIFVHQEDSNWPLAEGTVLKKKFDDIFAATKYTKALEALRKIRTEKVQLVKVMLSEQKLYANLKEQATRLNNTIADCREEQTRLRSEIERLGPLIQEQESVLSDVDSRLHQLLDLEHRAEGLQGQLQANIKHTAELFSKLKDGDFEESTEELEEYLRSCDAQISSLQGQISTVETEAFKHQQHAKAFRDRLQTVVASQNRLKAEADAHIASLRDRDQFLLAAAAELSLPIPPGAGTGDALPPASVLALSSELDAYVSQLESGYSQVKSANRAEDDRLAAEAGVKVTAITANREAIRSRERSLGEKKRKVEETEGKLGELVISPAVLEEVRGREQEARQKLDGRRAEFEREKLGEAADREAVAMESCRRGIMALRQERQQVEAATEGQTKLRLKRQDALSAQEALNTALTSRRSRLVAQLGTDELPPVEELRSRMEAVVARRRGEAQEAGQQLQRTAARHSSLQGELRTVQQQLQQSEAELASARRKLREGLRQALGKDEDEAQYPGTLGTRESAAQAALKKVSLAGSMLHVMQSYRDSVHGGDACPVCRRHFQGTEREQCLEYMDEEIQVLPDKLAQKEAQLTGLQQQVQDLRALQPLWHRTDTLATSTLPPLRERALSLQQEVDGLSAQVDEASEVVAVLQHEEQEAALVLNEVVAPVCSRHEAVLKLRAEAAAMERQMAARSSSRTVADVDGDLDEAERVRDQHQRTLDDVRAREQRFRNDITHLDSSFRQLQMELQRAIYKLETHVTLTQQVEELDQQIKSMQCEISDLEALQKPLEAERDRIAAVRREAKVAADALEEEAEGKLRGARKLQDQLAVKSRVILEYEAAGKEAELQRVEAEEVKLQQQVRSEEEAEQKLREQVVEIKKQLGESEPLKRDIQDCLSWRQLMGEQKRLEGKLGGLQETIAQIGKRGDLNERRAAAEDSKGGLKQQQDMLRGELSSQQAILQGAKRDLAVPQYQGIEEKYRKHVIKLKTTEMANSDIDKYHKALEKALLAFHSSKMSEINRIMKEMWQKTYRGQDIDYIAIKADAEGARSYNYRVVMYSGGAELEMRGRCSAGQKVLASLVIRLALAETFCLACGILALDEPTTNLDAENAASLADALATVMKNRADQENFQLIVITHDERFANLIGTREHADLMWRVTKDDKQHTLVRAEEVSG